MSRIETWEPDSVEDELRGWAFQANCERAVKGKKGQAFLQELEAALIAMPEKKLVPRFQNELGYVCPLSAVYLKRKIAEGKTRDQALDELERSIPPDGYGWDATVAASEALKIVKPLAYQVMYVNDEDCYGATPEERYSRVLAWVRSELKVVAP